MWRGLFDRKTIPVPKRRFSRLQLEALEGRIVPASFDWTGAGATALVSDANNWAQRAAPTSTTDMLSFSGLAAPVPPAGMPGMPPLPGGGQPNPTKSVIFDAAAPAKFGSIFFAAQYSGGVTFDRSVTINMLAVAGQTLTVNGGKTLSVGGAGLSNSTLQGSGTIEVGAAGGQVGMMSLSGSTHISVATFTVDANSRLMIGGDLTLTPTPLTNNGTLYWGAGTITPVLGTIVNNGLFQISGTDLTMAAGGMVVDNGQIVVDQAATSTLTLASDLTLSANAARPAVIVRSGTATLTGSVLDGATIEIDGAADLTVGGQSFVTGGSANFVGHGTLTISGNLTALANTTLNVEPAVVLALDGEIQGWGSFDFTTSFTSTRGILLNTSVIANNVTLNEALRSISLTNSKLTMSGSSTWVSGTIVLTNSILENQGVFYDRTNASLRTFGGGSQFLNDANAHYVKTAATGGGVANFAATFQNSGNFDLNGFTRTFLQGFYQYAGTVSLGGGTLGLTDNLNTPGDYWLLGGRLIADGTIWGGNLTNTGGTVDVNSGLNLLGNYEQWAGATLEFSPWFHLWNTGPAMVVTGSAHIRGTLVIDPSIGYTPASGTKAGVLSTGGFLVGPFDTIPTGWSIIYDGHDAWLVKN